MDESMLGIWPKFDVGDRVTPKEHKKKSWLAFGDTQDRVYTVKGVSLSKSFLILDDDTEASCTWFDKVETPNVQCVAGNGEHSEPNPKA